MRIFLAILILGLPSATQAAETADHWYVPDDHGKWCAYASDAAWRKAAGNQYENASSHVVDGKVQWISYLISDESGDWAVIDAYTFKDGKLASLDREYHSFNYSGFEAHYAMHNGKMVRVSRRFVTEAGKPENPKNIRKPDDGGAYVLAYAALDAMPFHRVLFEKPKSGKVCKPAIPDKPVTPPE